MTLLAKIAEHVRVDAPLGVLVFAGSAGAINVVHPPAWWAVVTPADSDLRADGCTRWALVTYRGAAASRESACCEWQILIWLSKIWREA